MLKINEIFISAQGEGNRVGIPSVFIRLSGCSAGCPYCDSKNSWNEGFVLEESEIVKRVVGYKKLYKNFQIVITGGEPFEQRIDLLVDLLKKENFFIAVETNGKNFYSTKIDWYAISPKDVYDYEINNGFIDKINEIKLIVNENLSLSVIKNIRNINGNFPIYLQPDFYNTEKYKNTFLFYNECIKSGIKNIRLGFQLHRLYGIE